MPFVLATGTESTGYGAAGYYGAGGDPAQQLAAYRQVLDEFARLHAQGLLGPADMARWQQYATAAQQLARGGGGG